MPAQDVGHGLITDLVAQLATFTLDLAIAPITVFTSQTGYEVFKFLLSSRAVATILLPIGPFTTNQLAMPIEDRFGLEDTNDSLVLPGGTTSDGLVSGSQCYESQLLGP